MILNNVKAVMKALLVVVVFCPLSCRRQLNICYLFNVKTVFSLNLDCVNKNSFQLATEKAELEETLAKGDGIVKEMEAKVKKLETERKELDKQVKNILM